MIRQLSVGVGVVAVSLVLAGPAQADGDRQGFIDFMRSQGVPSEYGWGTPGNDMGNILVARQVCDILSNGGSPADVPYLGWVQNNYRDALITGAQRFYCPGTLK